MLMCYVINLIKETRRRQWMEQQLSAQNISFTIVTAVDIEAVQKDYSEYRSDERRRKLTDPEVGCLLSHIGVWRLIAEGPADFGVILEDDVHIAQDFSEFLRVFPGDPNELAVHKIETFRASITMARDIAYHAGVRVARALFSNHGGSAAYIISRRLAKELLRHADSFCYAMDTELFEIERRSFSGYPAYQWVPAPCVQDFLLDDESSSQELSSAFETLGRYDLTNLEPSRFLTYTEPFRRVLRKPYRTLYSLCLLPRGRIRTEVPYG